MPDPSCENCFYWIDGQYFDTGYCRRYAPRGVEKPGAYNPQNALWAEWPIVRDADWCGEFKPKPETPAGGEK